MKEKYIDTNTLLKMLLRNLNSRVVLNIVGRLGVVNLLLIIPRSFYFPVLKFKSR